MEAQSRARCVLCRKSGMGAALQTPHWPLRIAGTTLLEPLSQAAGVGDPQRHGHSEVVNIINLENWGHN